MLLRVVGFGAVCRQFKIPTDAVSHFVHLARENTMTSRFSHGVSAQKTGCDWDQGKVSLALLNRCSTSTDEMRDAIADISVL